MELEVFLLGPPLGFEPPPLPFVEAADFLLLVSCNFLFEAADDVFRLFEERLDSIVGTGGGALVSPLLPLEQAVIKKNQFELNLQSDLDLSKPKSAYFHTMNSTKGFPQDSFVS